MAYHIAVCDDNPTDSAYVGSLLDFWAKERKISLHVEIFPSSEAFWFRYAEDKTFDFLLLDIEMGPMDGVTLAKHVRREDKSLQIIFVTGYSDYLAEGYDVSALHYLLKPINQEKLWSVLDKGIEILRQRGRCLNLELSGELVRIPLCEIRYLEVHQNYVTLHSRQEYTIKRPLRDFEQELDANFHRVGRSIIVNLSFIRRVTKTEIHLAEGTILPLPRGAYHTLNRAIITYS